MDPTPETTEQTTVLHEEYSWDASEYVFHEKSIGWYLLFWLVVAALCAALGFFQQWLSMAVIVAMALAIVVYTRKQPRTLHYTLDEHGVTIEGKAMAYSTFQSFSLSEEVAWHSADLEPTKRFVPRLTLMLESDDVDKIEKILSAHLPRVDREPDWVERASRYFRF